MADEAITKNDDNNSGEKTMGDLNVENDAKKSETKTKNSVMTDDKGKSQSKDSVLNVDTKEKSQSGDSLSTNKINKSNTATKSKDSVTIDNSSKPKDIVTTDAENRKTSKDLVDPSNIKERSNSKELEKYNLNLNQRKGQINCSNKLQFSSEDDEAETDNEEANWNDSLIYSEDESSEDDNLSTGSSDIEVDIDKMQHPLHNRLRGRLKKKFRFKVIRDIKVKPNKYTVNTSRKIQMTSNMERPFIIWEDSVNHTPTKIIKPGQEEWLTNPVIYSFPNQSLRKYTLKQLMEKAFYNPYKIPLPGTKNKLDYDNIKLKSNKDDEDTSDDESFTNALKILPEHSKNPPIDKNNIVFKLKETDTMCLLELESVASNPNNIRGQEIKHKNNNMIESRKKLKKLSDKNTQTFNISNITRSKITQMAKPKRKDDWGHTTYWMIHDVEEQKKENKPVQKIKKKIGKVDVIVYAEMLSIEGPLIEKKIYISNKVKWFQTGLVIERLLLSNNAYKQQLIFYDLLKSNPLSIREVSFRYRLQRLWTLTNADAKDKIVTCMCWHFFKKNIMAAGYGRFNIPLKMQGLILIWNNKNLSNPEREYRFEHSVTSVQFSCTYPAILAVGFYSGLVMIINIIKYQKLKIVSQNMLSHKTLVYPVWQIIWLKQQQLKTSTYIEKIVECRADGCVYKYTKAHLFDKTLIMKISKMKGSVKGIPYMKICQPYVIPLVRHAAVLCIALHPEKNDIYYLGSDEGAVFKCSLLDVHLHSDMFLAHSGPVYTIQFHPSCSKIFLTCGADWNVRVWAEGINIPLLTMISGMSAVPMACWSPKNPTIIMSITSTRIELWDINRRINLPQATVENPYKLLFTSMTFSRCGNNLCVGDDGGNISIYTFSEMPFPPKNGDMVLALAILKSLIPNPKLLKEVQNLGDPFNIPQLYTRILNLPL